MIVGIIASKPAEQAGDRPRWCGLAAPGIKHMNGCAVMAYAAGQGGTMKTDKLWHWVTGLAIAGMLDSLYLLLFQTGRLRRLVCPIFGEGCEQVVGSPAAYPGGVPDAVLGVAGYTVAAATALAIPRAVGKTKKRLATAAIAGSLAAIALSGYLTYAQPKKTGAWCFWCLASAGISAAMASVALCGAREILRER